MPTIEPLSAQECLDFILTHKEEILDGDYDISLKPAWIRDRLIPKETMIFLITCSADHWRLIVKYADLNDTDLLRVLKNHNYSRLPLNPICPIDILKDLAKNQNSCIREDVANNPSCSIEILDILSKDSDNNVRVAVACNINATAELLSRYVTEISRYDGDQKSKLLHALVWHKNISTDDLIRIKELSNNPVYSYHLFNVYANHFDQGLERTLFYDINKRINNEISVADLEQNNDTKNNFFQKQDNNKGLFFIVVITIILLCIMLLR
jgi:hypothetical protein